MLKMLRDALRDVFLPNIGAYNPKRQQRRILFFSIIAGIVIAVAFGFALYYLSVSGRLR
jgi:high-affinity Fe2+/Pb2+ permease